MYGRIFAAALLMVAWSAVAWAGDPAKARLAYEKGFKAYNLQQYEDALAMFTRGYEEQPDPVFLFNIGQCQKMMGRYVEAVRSYRAYLSQADGDEAQRAKVQKLIAEAEQAERDRPELPQKSAAAAPAVPVAAPAAPAPWYRSATGWALFAGGGATLAVGGGLFAQGNADDAAIARASSLVQAQQLGEDRDHFRAAGVALIAIGGASLVAGTVVFAVLGARRQAVHAAAIGPAVAKGGAF